MTLVAAAALYYLRGAPGLSNREIGERLVLGQATVKTHVNRIFAKTGVQSRAQAVRYAITNGLAGPGSGG